MAKLRIAEIDIDPDWLEVLTLEQLAMVYSVEKEKPVSKLRDKATGIERLRTTLYAAGVLGPEVDVATERRVDGDAGEQSARIFLLVSSNPKRAGTKAYVRFALYRDGTTVDEALAAGITRLDLRRHAGRGYSCLRRERPDGLPDSAASATPDELRSETTIPASSMAASG